MTEALDLEGAAGLEALFGRPRRSNGARRMTEAKKSLLKALAAAPNGIAGATAPGQWHVEIGNGRWSSEAWTTSTVRALTTQKYLAKISRASASITPAGREQAALAVVKEQG